MIKYNGGEYMFLRTLRIQGAEGYETESNKRNEHERFQ